MKELVIIQSRLKAPKSKTNTFGKYNYRSCEDILEAVKPLLLETKCVLTINDEIVEILGKLFVRATATLTNSENIFVQTNAYAQIPESQGGMTVSQITGSTSSYARKYALNGLFAIDDNKDADDLNTYGKEEKPAPVKKTTTKGKKEIDMTPMKTDALDSKPTILDAYQELNEATTHDALLAVWNKYKGLFGTDENFKNAVKMHPNNKK